MDSYDNRLISNNSIHKQPLANVKNLENEKIGESDCAVSAVSITNDIAHNDDCSKDIYNSEKLCSVNKPFVMPNELYISLDSDVSRSSKMHSTNDRLDFYSLGCHSTPASPEETDRLRGKQMKKELSAFHSPIIEKKIPFSYSTSFVRTSKSEDHLQKSSFTTVNIDIEDELASSLDTLLDTKQDNIYNELESQENLASSSPIVNCRSESPEEIIPKAESPKSELSPSSSETSSPSKISIKVTEIQDTRQRHEDQLSESSGSEIIPSESSTTIRRDDSECSECECTSEQISAISSLEDHTDRSHGTNSDLGSPVESLSPGLEVNLDDDWFCDLDLKDDVQDLPTSRTVVANRTKQVPSHIELNLTKTATVYNRDALQPSTQSLTVDRSPTSISSSISMPKTEDRCEISVESPTSPCSEDTFGDVSYHELTESYDEESAADIDELPQRSESPPTDDESDIESLHSFHYSPKAVDLPSATRLAKRLYHLDGFKKTDVSRHLSKNNEFSKAVAEEYVRFFDFTGDSLDAALRKFLSQFCLTGETQERERVLVHFSKRFLDSNSGCFRSQDAVHTLTCALMLLNSDLHGENQCRKMVCGEFIVNLADLNDGENFPRDVLKSLYHSIKSNPLEWATEEQSDNKKNNSNSHNSSTDYKQNFIGHNPFLEVPNPNCATEYKKGYVMRKSCIDPSGKKTALGKRSWKMLYATLRDLVLYLHKDEHGFKKNQLYDSLHNSIRIHHAFAEKAVDYTKKQYVFRLHTADQAVYLFQTSDSKELESWVDTINLVAASLSSPPLACGVGCQRKFQRPLLPVSHTKLNLREQLQDHDTRIVWLEKEYEEHLSKTPDRGLRSRFVHEYVEKEAHLQNELTRYRTYGYLLRTRMAQYPELETPLVQTSIGELDEPTEKIKTGNSPGNSPVRTKSQRASVAPTEKTNLQKL